MVLKVMAAVETNPFRATTTSLVNTATGQCADRAVEECLLNVEQIGCKAVSNALAGNQEKITVVKLKTFHT